MDDICLTKDKPKEPTICDLSRRNLDYEDIFFGISLFPAYPCESLQAFSHKIEMEALTRTDIVRLIGFIQLDSFALSVAISKGVHPVTGCAGYNKLSNVKAAQGLMERNKKWILELEELLHANK